VLAVIPGDSLEQRFGGTCPDKNDNFFPPNMDVEGEKMMNMQEARKLLGYEGLENQPRQL